MTPDARRLLRRAVLALVLAVLAPRARADEPALRTPELEAHQRALKQIEATLLREPARRHFAKAAREAAARRTAKRRPGASVREAPPTPRPEAPPAPDATIAPTALEATAAVPANVRANNPFGEGNTVGQAEEATAALGRNVLVAWNDGQGFVTGTDTQGFAYSLDGGAKFKDMGTIKRPAAFPAWKWTSDPTLAVNEKTGRFYYCGLANSDATHNAIGVAIGHFTADTFTWDTTFVVRNALNSANMLDKQWFAVDSLKNHAYVSFTTFTGTATRIDYVRSQDGGRTWAAPAQVSDPLETIGVQGSRVAVGPAGETWVTWQSIGPVDLDYLYARRSPDGSAAMFGARALAASFYPNFGTGGPGYNRSRGVHYPSLAVDRTIGVNRGRAYVAWNESYNWFDDTFSITNPKSEVEGNDAAASATPFTIGQTLRGRLASGNDVDWWKVPLALGEHLIVYADSLEDNMTYAMRLSAPAPDSLQRLCFGGDTDSVGGVLSAVYTFTAPVAGTYHLRVSGAYPTSKAGDYRILTRAGVRSTERGRDQRDVFVTWSDNNASWATPVRVNDSAIGFDDWLPEVAVGGDGCPYMMWRDHRGDPYGSRTRQYVSRSINGGTSWVGSVPLASTTGNFTTSQSNLQPNEGDYNALSGDARALHAAWADGRGPDVDVYTATFDMRHEFRECAFPMPVVKSTTLTLTWTLANLNTVFSNNFTYTITSQRNWPMPSGGLINLPAGTTGTISRDVTVPDTAAVGRNVITLTATNLRGTLALPCPTTLTVYASLVDAPAPGAVAFALHPSVPNPARGATRLSYALPATAHVTLRVYGLRGERIRTLVDAERPAGTHAVTWDGRDDRGRIVGSGTYFIRLEAGGRQATGRMLWLR